MRYTKSMLEKLTKNLYQLGFVVRLEKGNFQSGSCIVMHKKMIVLNKFVTVEEQIKSLIKAIHEIPLEIESFEPEVRKIMQSLQQTSIFSVSNV